jgi:hypothetical protein
MSEKPREGAADAAAPETPNTNAPAAAGGQTPPAAPPPYARAGEAFTGWFNDRVKRLPNPTVMLGTRRAHVVALLADGRLQVEVETEALEPERQFVAFEGQYLDQLVRRIAAIGL